MRPKSDGGASFSIPSISSGPRAYGKRHTGKRPTASGLRQEVLSKRSTASGPRQAAYGKRTSASSPPNQAPSTVTPTPGILGPVSALGINVTRLNVRQSWETDFCDRRLEYICVTNRCRRFKTPWSKTRLIESCDSVNAFFVSIFSNSFEKSILIAKHVFNYPYFDGIKRNSFTLIQVLYLNGPKSAKMKI